MQRLMMMGPENAAGRSAGLRGEVPVKIIAADGGKKNESHQSRRRRRSQQQLARLPGHQDGAKGNIEAAENKIIGYFSDHAVPVKSYGKLRIQNDDLWGRDRVGGHAVRRDGKEFELQGIVRVTACAEVVIPVQHVPELPLSRTAEIGDVGGKRSGSCQDEGRSLIQPYADGIESTGAESAAAVVEFEHGDHRIVGLYFRIDRFQADLGMCAGVA